jgi:PST family polysaccharide transporter
VFSMFAGVAAGVVMAVLQFGYWSIVGSNLAMALAKCVFTWTLSGWRPALPARRTGTRPLVNFGASLTFSGFIWVLTKGVDTLLIGKFYGANSVGYYSRATALLNRPIDQLLGPISSVFLPVLSRMQNQPERYRLAFLQVYEAMALLFFSFTAVMLAVAHPIVLVLFGHKWEPTAPIFAALTVAALQAPLSVAATWLYTTQGRSRDVVLCTIVTSVINVISYAAGVPFGPVGVALSFSLGGLFLKLPVLHYYAGHSGPVSTGDIWRSFFKPLPVWIAAFGAAWFTRHCLIEQADWIQLVAAGTAGCLGAAAATALIPSQRETAMHVLKLVLDVVRKRLSPAPLKTENAVPHV